MKGIKKAYSSPDKSEVEEEAHSDSESWITTTQQEKSVNEIEIDIGCTAEELSQFENYDIGRDHLSFHK